MLALPFISGALHWSKLILQSPLKLGCLPLHVAHSIFPVLSSWPERTNEIREQETESRINSKRYGQTLMMLLTRIAESARKWSSGDAVTFTYWEKKISVISHLFLKRPQRDKPFKPQQPLVLRYVSDQNSIRNQTFVSNFPITELAELWHSQTFLWLYIIFRTKFEN